MTVSGPNFTPEDGVVTVIVTGCDTLDMWPELLNSDEDGYWKDMRFVRLQSLVCVTCGSAGAHAATHPHQGLGSLKSVPQGLHATGNGGV
eukprot:2323763-Rhodomonas_salina.1